MKTKNRTFRSYRLMIAFLITTLILAFMFVAGARADEVIETVTFAWEQDDKTNVTQWELHQGVSAGGPYVNIGDIPYTGGDENTFSAPIESTVTGPPGTTQRRYFVLRTCGDVPVEGGGTEYQCSEFSGEVHHDFWIPVGSFQVPVNFRIVPSTQ